MVTISKLPAALGASVQDVDREQLLVDEDLPNVVMEALEENGVLVLRDLHLDDDAQVGFCDRLGEIVTYAGNPNPKIMRIGADPAKSPSAGYLKGTFDWHLDGATMDVPIKATILTAHAVADHGGDTEFASSYAAYDDLTDEEKERFASIRVIHSPAAAYRRAYEDPTPEQLESWARAQEKEQPLVWQQRNGRRSLVLGNTALRVVGMDDDEGQAFLDDLVARATRPERVYRHEWAVGDTVIWDNRGVLHRANPYDDTSERDMHRTTLVGDEPIR